MKEIQAINAVRKDAVEKGMSLEEAMKKWKTIEDVPAQFKESEQKVNKKKNEASVRCNVLGRSLSVTVQPFLSL